MLTDAEISEIWTRYVNAEWADADPMQCVLDIGRLMGHVSHQRQIIRDLRGIVAHYRDDDTYTAEEHEALLRHLGTPPAPPERG